MQISIAIILVIITTIILFIICELLEDNKNKGIITYDRKKRKESLYKPSIRIRRRKNGR